MNDQVFRFPFDTLPLRQFCAIMGYTPEAIRSKIHRREWAEGQEFCKDPHGHIHIILKGYDQWARSGTASSHMASASG